MPLPLNFIDEVRNIIKDYLKAYGNIAIGKVDPLGLLHIGGNGNISEFMDSYGGNSALAFRRANGTILAPTAVLADEIIGFLGARAYGATGFSTITRANLLFCVAENWTDSAQGTYILLRTTPIGSTTTSNRIRIDENGILVSQRVREQGTYAGIYVADGSTAQSIPTGTTYTKLTGFATNGLNSNCTSDAANDKITITKTGVYKVDASINGSSGTANVTFKFAAFLNGVEQSNCHCHRKYAAAGDNGSSSITGLIDVTTVPWDLDLRARHDNGGSVDFTPTYMNMNTSYLGET